VAGCFKEPLVVIGTGGTRAAQPSAAERSRVAGMDKEALENEVLRLAGENDSLRQEVEKLKRENKALKSEKDALKNQVERLQDQMKDLRKR